MTIVLWMTNLSDHRSTGVHVGAAPRFYIESGIYTLDRNALAIVELFGHGRDSSHILSARLHFLSRLFCYPPSANRIDRRFFLLHSSLSLHWKLDRRLRPWVGQLKESFLSLVILLDFHIFFAMGKKKLGNRRRRRINLGRWLFQFWNVSCCTQQ